MKHLEDKIRNNRNAFNTEAPSPDHLEKFRSKLDTDLSMQPVSWIERFGFSLRVAAVIVLFITAGTFFYTGSFSWVRNLLTEKIVAAELPEEVKEVMQYYNVITDKKVSQIDDLAVSEDEAKRIKEMAMFELKELESSRIELEQEYARNPNSERIMNALLMNQQRRAKILDKIINTLNQVN